MEWALNHQNWSVKFKKILRTYESEFELSGSKRVTSAEEKMLPDCLVPTVKYDGGSVMVHGCFSGNGVGDLIKIDRIMKIQENFRRKCYSV